MALELANLILAAYMTGVMWIVQVVHYPLFAAVGDAQWPAYEAAHRRRITVVVGPAMLAQPLVAAAVLAARPDPLAGANLVLTATLLLSTVVVFGPLHDRLQAGLDAREHRRLLRNNVLRAAGWSAQATVAAVLLATV